MLLPGWEQDNMLPNSSNWLTKLLVHPIISYVIFYFIRYSQYFLLLNTTEKFLLLFLYKHFIYYAVCRPPQPPKGSPGSATQQHLVARKDALQEIKCLIYFEISIIFKIWRITPNSTASLECSPEELSPEATPVN